GDLRTLQFANQGSLDPFGNGVANARSINSRFSHTVSTKAVRAMHATRVLTSGEESFQICEAVPVDANPAHVEVRCWRHFDSFSRQIEANPQTAIAHSLKITFDEIRPEMGDINPYAPILSAAPGHDFHKTSARNTVPC